MRGLQIESLLRKTFASGVGDAVQHEDDSELLHTTAQESWWGSLAAEHPFLSCKGSSVSMGPEVHYQRAALVSTLSLEVEKVVIASF